MKTLLFNYLHTSFFVVSVEAAIIKLVAAVVIIIFVKSIAPDDILFKYK